MASDDDSKRKTSSPESTLAVANAEPKTEIVNDEVHEGDDLQPHDLIYGLEVILEAAKDEKIQAVVLQGLTIWGQTRQHEADKLAEAKKVESESQKTANIDLYAKQLTAVMSQLRGRFVLSFGALLSVSGLGYAHVIDAQAVVVLLTAIVGSLFVQPKNLDQK